MADTIKSGGLDISKLFLGTETVSAAYAGDKKVWPAESSSGWYFGRHIIDYTTVYKYEDLEERVQELVALGMEEADARNNIICLPDVNGNLWWASSSSGYFALVEVQHLLELFGTPKSDFVYYMTFNYMTGSFETTWVECHAISQTMNDIMSSEWSQYLPDEYKSGEKALTQEAMNTALKQAGFKPVDFEKLFSKSFASKPEELIHAVDDSTLVTGYYTSQELADKVEECRLWWVNTLHLFDYKE